MWSDGTWYQFSDPADYGINLSQVIDPVLCSPTVGITANSDVEDITLAPNPSNGLVSVFVGLNTASSVSVRIMNSLGQVVKTDKMNAGFGGKVDFDFTNYSNGVYFVEVRTGSSVSTKRLVINK